MAKKNKVFAVFGLGSFGQTVTDVLVSGGGEVMVIDSDADMIELYKNKATSSLLLDTTDEKAMAKAPLEDIDIAIIAVNNMETSIITTALLRKRGVPYLLCRALSSIHAQVLRQIGANEVINLQEDGGKRIANRLISPEILNNIAITDEYSLAQFYVPPAFIEKTVADLELKKFNLRLVGIKRTDISVDSIGNPVRKETLIFYQPGIDDVLVDGDILVMIGKNRNFDSFRELW